MEISPQWTAAVIAALGLGVSAGTWMERRREMTRKALPIIRTIWTSGDGGVAARITIVNRLDEDLVVTEVAAKAKMEIRTSSYDTATGDVLPGPATVVSSPRTVRWLIQPGKLYQETIYIVGPSTPRWLRLTMSSSAETLRRKRLVSRDSQ